MADVSLVPFRPVAPHPAHRRYRVVGLAAGLGLVAGAGIALVGVLVGLAARGGPPAPAPAPPLAATPPGGGVRVLAVPAYRADLAPRSAPSPSAVTWATRVVSLSSQYGDPQWSATQALGAPDTYPATGDLPTAWAPRTADGGHEFIEVGLPAPTRIRAVVVAETMGAGAITEIDARAAPGGVRERLVSVPVTPGAHVGGAVMRRFDLHGCTEAPVATLTVTLDTRSVAGWNELDAIGVEPCAEE
ncbi:MAG: hypothetical protein R2939_12685 [Kofleriaceae bacterium]